MFDLSKLTKLMDRLLDIMDRQTVAMERLADVGEALVEEREDDQI
jgi:hypothetical protein